ncbi:hypothetical protein KSP40_PGU015497 [Platanthera guangdongensis]|uniref:Uncharacterized protein n=1 Tax=Platanthera guangdongensis TaxID=2320717 RepID=A0ABR2MN55_9ASPA
MEVGRVEQVRPALAQGHKEVKLRLKTHHKNLESVLSLYGDITVKKNCETDKPELAAGTTGWCAPQAHARYRSWWSFIILRNVDHISDPYLHFSGLVWYEKFWDSKAQQATTMVSTASQGGGRIRTFDSRLDE